MLLKRLLILLVILLAACNLPQPTAEPTFDPNVVATMVEETLAGFSTPTSQVLPATVSVTFGSEGNFTITATDTTDATKTAGTGASTKANP